jgi:serine/threonine protein kinase
MELSATNIQSICEAERRIKSLPGEVIFEGRMRSSNAPLIIKTYGKSSLSQEQKNKFEGIIKIIKQLGEIDLSRIEHVEFHETGPLVAFSVPEGVMLFEFIDNKSGNELISLKNRMTMIRSLGETFQKIHEKLGSVGSINLANIIVSPKSSKLTLIDCGIAQRSGIATSGFSPLVTPFQAPEVITGGNPTVSSDIFSFAAIAYLILTESRPFGGENINAIVAAMLSYKTPNISEHIKGCSQRVVAVFTRAFSSNPSLRPHSIAEFLRDLEETMVSSGLLSSAESMDFFKGRAKTKNQNSFKYSLPKILSFGIILIGLSFAFYSLVPKSEIEELLETVSLSDMADTKSELVDISNPLSFKLSNLPKLSELELAALLSHPQTDEELGMTLVTEADSREILLRGEIFGAALKSPFFTVKIEALKALEASGQAASLSPLVLSLASDVDPLVRGYAARTLGRVGNTETMTGLENWLASEEDVQVQGILKESIQSIKGRTQ